LLSGEDEHVSIRLGYLDRAANALYRQGDEFGDNDALKEAVTAYREALKEYTRERVPLDWAMTQNNLGAALSTLGGRTGNRLKFAEARRAVEGAFEIFMQAGQEQYRGYFEDRLQEIDRQIAALTPPR
jgi:tetratricopeptide (TPR) repeat protein